MVTILSPGFMSLIRTEQERRTSPLMCTEQAPHCATPQPYFVPVRPACSRITQRSGVSASACTSRTLPLILSFAMDVLLKPDGESYMRKPGHPRYPTPLAMSAAHRIITTTAASSQWITERIEAILRSVRAGICPCFKDLLQERNSTVG